MESLPTQSRDMVRDHYLNGLSIAALAEKNCRQPANIRLMLHRARLALAECLRRRGVLSYA